MEWCLVCWECVCVCVCLCVCVFVTMCFGYVQIASVALAKWESSVWFSCEWGPFLFLSNTSDVTPCVFPLNRLHLQRVQCTIVKPLSAVSSCIGYDFKAKRSVFGFAPVSSAATHLCACSMSQQWVTALNCIGCICQGELSRGSHRVWREVPFCSFPQL